MKSWFLEVNLFLCLLLGLRCLGLIFVYLFESLNVSLLTSRLVELNI